jgi:acyl-CoA reductase-like NAD-dependent aldehyde dehydrogenase
MGKLITLEMGGEARAEIEKCALGCDYYAEHAAEFLADEPVGPTPAAATSPTSRSAPCSR